MFFDEIKSDELIEDEENAHEYLQSYIEVLEKKTVWDIINEYCVDFKYITYENNENVVNFGGVELSLESNVKLYICGESSIETKDGYYVEIPENLLYHTICETFEVLYELGITYEDISKNLNKKKSIGLK